MYTQWKQLSPELQEPGAREIERLPAAAALGFNVDIKVKNFGHFQAPIIDFNAESLAVDVTALSDLRKLESQIEGITITHGTRKVRSIERPNVKIRKDDSQWKLIILLNPTERKAAERRHKRIKTRENFKPFLWVSDPFHLSRIVNFQVENFNVDGLQLRTSLCNKHIIVGSILENCQLLLPGIGILTVNLVICNAFLKDKHLVFGCLFQPINKKALEMLAQYAIIGGDNLPPYLNQRKELLRAAGLTTHSLSKPCTIKVVETYQELEQIREVRFVAYKAAAKTPPGATSEMMEDEYDASSIIYCAKYGPDVIATMRVNISKSDEQKFPFETYFGSCESLGISRHNSCEISRLAILPEFQRSDLFTGFLKVITQMLVKLHLDTMFCVATNKLSLMYQRIGTERMADPIRHPVLTDEFLNLYRIKTSSFLTGENMEFEVWKKISEEAISHLIYYGFLSS
jgi:N-acyl amino acid synthase FeeM